MLARSGQLATYIKRNSHLSRDRLPGDEPYCTHSQIVYYYAKDGEKLAIVHQYLRPDGTLGASGIPDPKYLRLADRILYVRAEEHSGERS